MSKHHHHDKCCCNPMTSYGMLEGYGGGGIGGYSGGYAAGGGNSFVKWIYALLILIVIVLQFGRNNRTCAVRTGNCCSSEIAVSSCGKSDGLLGCNGDNQLIDNSVLFIIIVFLLIICTGCFGGHGTGTGAAAYGAGGFGY